MCRLFLILASLVVCQICVGNTYWKRDYSLADSIARSVEPRRHITDLSHRLTQSLATEVDKYRAIYSWVALNIAYDCKGYHAKKYTVDAERVLKTGKSVCAGYANLFKALCDASGLRAEVISGWARGRTDINRELKRNPRHAWVAIWIDNVRYYCDPTWAAGYAQAEVYSISVTHGKRSAGVDFHRDCDDPDTIIFTYTLEQYAPNLTIFVNHVGLAVYLVVK